MSIKAIICFLLMLSIFNGCTVFEDVKPWEKGDLAREIMTEGGMHPEVTKFESHIYYSKEASTGGAGVAGGGCGCN